MIVNISGASGSGKTTLVAYLVGQYPFIYQKLIPYTSRPKRITEKEGVDYYFVDEDFFVDKEDFVLPRKRSDGLYAIKKTDLDLSNNSKLLTTFPPKGVLKLEGLNFSVKCFYLLLDSKDRKKRMLQRGDKISDIEKRLIADEKESSFEAVKSILPSHSIFLLDGRKEISEVASLLHDLLFTELKQ